MAKYPDLKFRRVGIYEYKKTGTSLMFFMGRLLGEPANVHEGCAYIRLKRTKTDSVTWSTLDKWGVAYGLTTPEAKKTADMNYRRWKIKQEGK